MEIQLTSVSPFSFERIKEGELVRIEHKPPKRNEYREKIGPANECYLVVKGQTKIGMIPPDVVKQHKDLLKRKICRVIRLDQTKSIVIVAIGEAEGRQREPIGLI